MLSPVAVVAALAAYMLLLVGIAAWAEKRGPVAAALADSPLVYVLSLGVYCTSWTFYGSVGVAARNGLLFLAIYLGPTLVWMLGWTLIRRLARFKAAHRVSNLGDFLSARYGRTAGLPALATLLALVAINPYIALQLKVILSTFHIMVDDQLASRWPGAGDTMEFLVVAFVVALTILFGLRQLDPSQRQRGVMLVLAAQSLVKLLAFLAVGIFVTYHLHGGFNDIFARLATLPAAAGMGHDGSPRWYVTFLNWLVLAMGATLFLPRQFHVTIVELPRLSHLRTAMWGLPLFLLAINLFVYPIAGSGLLHGYPVAEADRFVLTLPLQHGSPWLALAVFIGGFSAAIGMVMISSMTLSVMVANNLVMPLAERLEPLGGLRRRGLAVRWATVTLLILAGYLFHKGVGDSYFLAGMGLISFAGVLQFAPAVLGGMLWRQASRTGAVWGLSAGFILWAYTLFLPAMVKSSWLPSSLLAEGLFGLPWLRPEALFGITGLDPLAHGVFWALAANIALFILGSCWRPATAAERQASTELQEGNSGWPAFPGAPASSDVALADKIARLKPILAQYLPPDQMQAILDDSLAAHQLLGRERISHVELLRFLGTVETALAGAIGTAAAHSALGRSSLVSATEAKEIARIYSEILADLNLSPEELRQRVDYYQERHDTLNRHAVELSEKVADLTQQMAARAQAEAALRESERRFRDELEAQVARRTAELSRANSALTVEICQRQEAEDSLRESYAELKHMNDKLAEAQNQLLQSEKMASIGQLAAGVAHEINNPIGFVNSNLGTLRGYVDDLLQLLDAYQALEADPADPDKLAEVQAQRQAADLEYLREDIPTLLRETLDGIQRVRQIVQDLKDFSHVDEAEWQEADLHAGLDSTLNVVWNELKYKAQVVKEYGALPLVSCIPSQINQVFMNLLVNAAQAIPTQGTITIRTGQEGKWARVEVADTGAGIPPEALHRIFEPFFTTKPVGKGTGLGLSVSYGIVRKHGGRIEVKSEPGQGTAFQIWLPIARRDEEAVVAS